LRFFHFFILLVVLSFSNCQSDKKKETKKHFVFQIISKQKHNKSNKILLQHKDKNTFTTVLTSSKEGNGFVIQSQDSLRLGLYYLKSENNKNRIPIFIDNTNLELIINKNDFQKSFVVGKSKNQIKFNKYFFEKKNTKDLFAFQKQFVTNNNSLLGAFVLKDMLGESAWRLKQTLILFENLDSLIKKTDEGKYIINYINLGLEKIASQDTETIKTDEETTNKKTYPISVIKKRSFSEYAPYFYGNAINGNELSAKTIFNNNKLILIDFWASWCLPCRSQTPELISLYNKYHSKGFEILSIAEDKNETSWKNAIIEDHMKWLHINDDFKRIANMYGVTTIPHAVLVNNQGGIIAKKVSPNRLANILYEEFGY
jgi:thiol-disulfide isomerase/thioredoxin